MSSPPQTASHQVIQLQQAQQASAAAGGIQIVQQIVTPTGEIQQIPVCFFLLYFSIKSFFDDIKL